MTSGTNSTSKLALGTVQFGMPYGVANQTGQVTREEAKSMLQLASSSGIDTIDTAIGYGNSENCLGEIGVDGFKIITKLPRVPGDCLDVRSWIWQQVSASMVRLGVTQVYGLLLHCPEQVIEPKGKIICQVLRELKEIGQVKKIGLSISSPSELDELFSLIQPDLVQAPFNIVDRRLYKSGWMQRLKANDVEIHVRSAFLQGLLLVESGMMPSKFSAWDDLWRVWRDWLENENVSALEACIGFVYSFSEIDRVVVGADNLMQFKQIVGATKCVSPLSFPDLESDSEYLITPVRWLAT